MTTQIQKAGPVTPSPGDVHVNRPLTQMSVAYMQDAKGFVATKVFPSIPSDSQSDVYFVWDRAGWNRDGMAERAPATESKGGNFTLSNSPFYCKVWAEHFDVPDQTRNNQDSPLALDRAATMWVTQQGLIRREIAFRDAYMKDGVWNRQLDGASTRSSTVDGSTGNRDIVRWSLAAGTPVEDLRLGKRIVQQRTGFRPNVLTLGRPVFDTLLDHTDIIERLDRGQTPGQPAVANEVAMAAIFELDEIAVMDAIVDGAGEGLAEDNSFIGGDHALLSYRPPAPGLMVASAGYTFNWTGMVGAGNQGMRIKRFRMEHLEADRVEGQLAFAQKIVSADLGLFIKDIV